MAIKSALLLGVVLVSLMLISEGMADARELIEAKGSLSLSPLY
jgi:hypothetical protein